MRGVTERAARQGFWPAILADLARRPIESAKAGACDVAEPTSIEEQCIAKGMRMTGQRRVIARVLEESMDHPDVEELHRRASAIDGGISIATVYRTVKLFEDAGIVARHDFRDGRSRYEAAPDEHHDHLIDLRTGAVLEFRDEEIERLQAEIARRMGFKLIDHRMELYAVPLSESQKDDET